MTSQNRNDTDDSLTEVLLGLDTLAAWPLSKSVTVRLISYRVRCGTRQIVLGLGPEGSPDSAGCVYYGSVIQIGAVLRMYYIGLAHGERTWHGRVCCAESSDGIQWTKPNLGLVNFRGSKNNNIVVDDCQAIFAVAVLYEPEEEQPLRRFKAVLKAKNSDGQVINNVAYSEDGFQWSSMRDTGLQVDFSGLLKRRGCYYLTGHLGGTFGARKLHVFMSYDFDFWAPASAVAFSRTRLGAYDPERGNAGEQVHQGAGLWDRGSVVLGVYGQWHGSDTNDRRFVSIDLGLILSQDCLHFYEPVTDFRFISAAEDDFLPPPATLHTRVSALMHGQGFANIGSRTLFWYAPWPEIASDGVRVATWDRDRLGYRAAVAGLPDPHLISAPLDSKPTISALTINASNSPYSHLVLEVLTERFEPVSGFSGADSCVVKGDGLRMPVVWPKGLPCLSDSAFRIKMTFGGVRKEDARMYALYVHRQA